VEFLSVNNLLPVITIKKYLTNSGLGNKVTPDFALSALGAFLV
jgi:hypothetical protein